MRIPLAVGVLWLALSAFVHAENEAPAPAQPTAPSEIEQLRLALEKTNQHIEALTKQIEQLTKALEAQHARSASASPEAIPVAEPVAVPAEPAPIPVAEPLKVHSVTKGETLTSISKIYGVTVEELQNVNKIVDGRRLQVGQLLTIPPPKNPQPPKKNE